MLVCYRLQRKEKKLKHKVIRRLNKNQRALDKISISSPALSVSLNSCMIFQKWREQVVSSIFNKTIKMFSLKRSLLLLRPLKKVIVRSDLIARVLFWKSHRIFTATLVASNVKVIHIFFFVFTKGVLCREMFWLFNYYFSCSVINVTIFNECYRKGSCTSDLLLFDDVEIHAILICFNFLASQKWFWPIANIFHNKLQNLKNHFFKVSSFFSNIR